MSKELEWVVPANTQLLRTSQGTFRMVKGQPIQVPKGEYEHTGAKPYKTTQTTAQSTETRSGGSGGSSKAGSGKK